jgi:hypothetical protein
MYYLYLSLHPLSERNKKLKTEDVCAVFITSPTSSEVRFAGLSFCLVFHPKVAHIDLLKSP